MTEINQDIQVNTTISLPLSTLCHFQSAIRGLLAEHSSVKTQDYPLTQQHTHQQYMSVTELNDTSSSAKAETALQGESVLAKSGRRYSADIIGLPSTTFT